MSSVLRSAFVHKGLPRGLPGPVMDGSGRPFLCSLPSFQTNEIPFITSYSHKSGLSQLHWSCRSSTNSIHFQRIFGCVSEQRHRCIPTLPSPALTLISLLFLVLPKGKILCVPKVAKLQFCVSHQEFLSAAPSQHPPGWGRRSRPRRPGEASRFRQIRILIIHSKARQSINKGKMIHRGEWDEQRKRLGAFPWPQNVELSRKGGSSPTTRSCCPAQPEETEFWWRWEWEMPPDANSALPARL